MKAICWLAVVALAVGIARAQDHTYIVDFEEFPEGEAITSQYEGLGVWFATVNRPTQPPIIAREGDPVRAFHTAGTDDAPMASGDAALTDPLISGDFRVGSDIEIRFAPIATSVRTYVTDLDGDDVVTLRAFRNGVEVASASQSAPANNAGDGKSYLLAVEAAEIDRVVLEPRASGNTVGWAMDFLVFTRPCEVEVCPPALVRVSQESAPGAGDFDSNVLGYTGYFLTTTDAASLYAYDVPDEHSYNGPLFTPATDRSHIVLAATNGEPGHDVSMLVIHDEPYSNANGGGKAEMRVQTAGECSSNAMVVRDDVPDVDDSYTGSAGSCEFTAKHEWNSENTDGFAISGLDVDGSVYLAFADVDNKTTTPAIQNLDSWAVVSPDGSVIMLNLVEGRRVRLDLVPPCIADFDRSGFVDLDDYVFFVSVFVDGLDSADVDGSGFVDTDDFTFFVLAFEAGC
ncbi:MAG: hypothetical protein L6Q35_00425 [Phycisphaerales bacterium]|nr:hypothetical protein [Phycisphaerales bacterium]